MPDEIITSRTVREALHAGRYGKPMGDSPLLWLHKVSAAVRADGHRDTPDSRGRALLYLLADLTAEQLQRRRGRRPAHDVTSAEQALALVVADFEAGSIDREAWSVLHFRYLTEYDEPMRTVEEATGQPERTLRRRLERGCQLLADVLIDVEREAAAAARRPHSLPAPLTKFIGREAELGAVRALLAEHRLVTLTGPGGIGKSRLAIRLATDLGGDFRDGVCFVELAALADGSHVPGTVMAALGLRDQAGRNPTESIVDCLAPRRQLLVVDNCEHLTDAAGDLLATVLRRCPKVQVLATSRARLGLPGEAAWSVPPMGLPSDGQTVTVGQAIHHDALRLFTNRAALAQSGFMLMEDNVALVSDICLQLDGIPLAIELAAARARLLSLAQIRERLVDRFLLLRGGAEPQRPQHETLQASLDWSVELLGLRERCLLRRLSVFQGGWTTAAAEAVCSGGEIDPGAVFGLQAELEAKSLVDVRHTELGPRFYMLETVRHDARRRLDAASETEKLRHQHFRHFQELAETARPELHGPHQVEWLSRLDAEQENFRTALRWPLQSGEIAGGLALAGSLSEYWDLRGQWREGREALEALLAAADPETDRGAQGRARVATGVLAARQHDFETAERFLKAGQALCAEVGDRVGVASALRGIGLMAHGHREHDLARECYEESLEISRRVEDRLAMAIARESLGMLALDSGDYDQAQHHLLESLAINSMIGNKRGIASSHNALGILARDRADFAAALSHYETGLASMREIGDRLGITNLQGNLANLLRLRGDYSTAQRLLTDNIEVLLDLGHKRAAARSLGNLAISYYESGEFGRALPYYREGLDIFRELGDRHNGVFMLNNMGKALLQLGDTDAARKLHDEALREAREIEFDDGVSHSLDCLGSLETRCGHLAAAQQHCSEALALNRASDHPLWIIESIEQLAIIAGARGQAIRALRLAGAAAQAREAIGAAMPAAESADFDAAIAQARTLVAPEAADRAFAEGCAMSLDEAAAYALGEVESGDGELNDVT